jgi:GNAT superfamily N-acetyltransferase
MIRAASYEDIPRLVEMGQRFHRESPYRDHVAVNPGHMSLLGRQLMEKGVLLVSEREGKVCGMIGLFIFPHFLSGEPIAVEVFWWVEPEYRGEGIKLLREAEQQARTAGAARIQMIAPNDQVATIYERLDYGFVESAYQKAL